MDLLVKRNNKAMIIFSILRPLFYHFVAINKAALTLGQQSYNPEMRNSNAWTSYVPVGGLRGHSPPPSLKQALGSWGWHCAGSQRSGALRTQGCDQCAPGLSAAPGGPWVMLALFFPPGGVSTADNCILSSALCTCEHGRSVKIWNLTDMFMPQLLGATALWR